MKNLLWMSFFWLGALSTFAFAQEMEFKDLKALIKAQNIGSVDEMLPLLPKSMKSRYLLVSESHSAQDGTPEFPRIIMFDSSARFIIGITGSLEGPGSNDVEIIQYNEYVEDFDFLNISFAEQEPVFRDGVHSPKPETCKTCHAKSSAPEDLNPIWNPYNVWPNFYGAMDDVINSSSPEGVNFKMFIQNQSNNGRYANLIGLPKIESMNGEKEWHISTKPKYYAKINSDNWERKYPRKGAYMSYARANYKFTQEIGHLVNRKVAAKIVRDDEYRRMKSMVAWAFDLNQKTPPAGLECQDGMEHSKLTSLLSRERYLMRNFRLGLVQNTLKNQNPPETPFEAVKREYLENSKNRSHERVYGSLYFHQKDHKVIARLRFTYECFGRKFPIESLDTTDSSSIGRSFGYGNSGASRFLKEAIAHFDK